MSDADVEWWPRDLDRLRRALEARLRARGHPSPQLAAALIATRGRLSLTRLDIATALTLSAESLQHLEAGDEHTMHPNDLRHDLRALLNEWDPIGLRDFGEDPGDEYDCMHEGLLLRLERGESSDEIEQFLARELREHFGLNPDPLDPAGFAIRLSEWHRARARPVAAD